MPSTDKAMALSSRPLISDSVMRVNTAITARITVGTTVHRSSNLRSPWTCSGNSSSEWSSRNRHQITAVPPKMIRNTMPAIRNTGSERESIDRAIGPCGLRVSNSAPEAHPDARAARTPSTPARTVRATRVGLSINVPPPGESRRRGSFPCGGSRVRRPRRPRSRRSGRLRRRGGAHSGSDHGAM